MASRMTFDNMATGVLVTCALVVTALVVHREFSPGASPTIPTRTISNRRAYATGIMRIDSPKPALTIVEFSDFQCPYCRNTYENIEKIRVKRPNAITLVYRNFPIDALHPHARDAALAAICSARQGRFPAYYHFAFTHQDSIGKLAWGDVAARIGIADRDVFDRCREDPATMALISSDSAAAATLKIGGTPLLLVGERAVYGAPSYEVLDQFVSDAIKKSSAQ